LPVAPAIQMGETMHRTKLRRIRWAVVTVGLATAAVLPAAPAGAVASPSELSQAAAPEVRPDGYIWADNYTWAEGYTWSE
jgi:hypothetical protein